MEVYDLPNEVKSHGCASHSVFVTLSLKAPKGAAIVSWGHSKSICRNRWTHPESLSAHRSWTTKQSSVEDPRSLSLGVRVETSSANGSRPTFN
jgi:hypothetical protein